MAVGDEELDFLDEPEKALKEGRADTASALIALRARSDQFGALVQEMVHSTTATTRERAEGLLRSAVMILTEEEYVARASGDADRLAAAQARRDEFVAAVDRFYAAWNGQDKAALREAISEISRIGRASRDEVEGAGPR
jgi:hypothetical protein